MTDKDIIKALECCCSETTEKNCGNCPLFNVGRPDCYRTLAKHSLDLINRLQADKDRLQRLLDYEEEKNTTLAKQMFVSGVKEFAEKIYTEINEALAQNHKVKVERINKLIARGIKSNDEFCYEIDGKILALRGIGDFIKSLVKEMVGEG